jgi:hypothetical protein
VHQVGGGAIPVGVWACASVLGVICGKGQPVRPGHGTIETQQLSPSTHGQTSSQICSSGIRARFQVLTHCGLRDPCRTCTDTLIHPQLPQLYPIHHIPCCSLPGSGVPPCPHPVHRSSKDSNASTGPHPSSTVSSATYLSDRSISNACQTFRARIWCGSSTIWTRYVSLYLFPLSP